MKPLPLFKKVLNFSAERYLKTAGDLFIYDGDYETALSLVDKTLEIEPHDVRALVLKGDILFCLNRDIEALEYFNKTLKLEPECIEAHISKASLLEILGKHREALDYCEKAMALMTPSTEYLLPSLYDQKLSLLIQLRRYRQANQLLEEAVNHLTAEECGYLLASYRPAIEWGCKDRHLLRERAKVLALQVLPGEKVQASL